MKYLSPAGIFFLIVCTGMLWANELAINGDFKGDTRQHDIPGWTILSGKASRIIVDGDDYAVELNGKTKICSRFCPVSGSNLVLEAKVRGSGIGKISYTARDNAGKMLNFPADGVRFSAFGRQSKVKATLPLPPEAAFVAVTLESAENSKIIIEDVEAEFKAPWRKSPLVNGAMPLIDDKFYPLSALATYPFSTTLLPGGDIEFELEEKKDDLWQVSSFDRNICKVKTEHDRNGFWPTDNRKCEVEIKALNPGNTVLILKNRSGQEVKINITVHATAGRH